MRQLKYTLFFLHGSQKYPALSPGSGLKSMKIPVLLKAILLCFSLSFSVFLASAQEDGTEGDSNEEIARELANPNTALGTMAFPIDYVHYSGDLPDAGTQNGFLLNFQPSLPIPISGGVNLFVRPLIPIFLSQPVYTAEGFEQKGPSLGNISADIAFGKTWPSKTITILGVFGSFPTASEEALRTDFTTLGPEAVVAQLFDWGVLGLLFSQAWGTSTVNGERASITAGQYFYTINLKNAWQLTGQPTWSYNHNADKGNRLTLPVALGLNKVTRFGKLPVKMSLQYWYYLVTPDAFGPQHQVRFQIAPVIPLPW